MGRAFTTILLALCGAAGCAAGPAEPGLIEPGRALSLRAGESAQTADGSLRIGFESVGADSRCPKGEQCVWAGDATVRVWLQRQGGTRLRIELHTAAGAARAGGVPDPGLRLLRLDPVPVSGKAIAQRDYVATLALDVER